MRREKGKKRPKRVRNSKIKVRKSNWKVRKGRKVKGGEEGIFRQQGGKEDSERKVKKD